MVLISDFFKLHCALSVKSIDDIGHERNKTGHKTIFGTKTHNCVYIITICLLSKLDNFEWKVSAKLDHIIIHFCPNEILT